MNDLDGLVLALATNAVARAATTLAVAAALTVPPAAAGRVVVLVVAATALVLTALLAIASPAFAQSSSGTYYVDTAYTGTTEVGSTTQPFKTIEKATAAAQANRYGGYIYTKTNGA